MTMETPEQVPERHEIQEASSDEGLLETSVSMVSRPVPTLRRLTSSPKVGWAVVVTLVIALASSVITAVQPETTLAPQLPSQPGFRTEEMVETLGVVFAILGPLF